MFSPATLQRRRFEHIESMLHPMQHFAVFRMGEHEPLARIGTRAFMTHDEAIDTLRRWYPGCLIYAYNPEA